MFEINLVPDIKSEMLNKLRLRNFVFLICVIVVSACVAVILILLVIIATQKVNISNQNNEISCRNLGTSESGTCKDYGTGIAKFSNVNELLTIQSQMKNLNAINSSKYDFERIFDILSTLLTVSTSRYTIKFSDVSMTMNTMTMSFEGNAYAKNNIGFSAVEAFKKNAPDTYYDYGTYYRKDNDGSFVEIPSFCINEELDKERNVIWGVYSKGTPGCEASMTGEKSEEDESSDEGTDEATSTDNDENAVTDGDDDATQDESANTNLIYIRRTYTDEEDKNLYKNGESELEKSSNGTLKINGKLRTISTGSNYYFESSCLVYTDGKIDKDATTENCPMTDINDYGSDPLIISDDHYGEDEDGNLVTAFEGVVYLNSDIFLATNHFIRFYGPNTKNVTDSYLQIEDMFTAEATEEK